MKNLYCGSTKQLIRTKYFFQKKIFCNLLRTQLPIQFVPNFLFNFLFNFDTFNFDTFNFATFNFATCNIFLRTNFQLDFNSLLTDTRLSQLDFNFSSKRSSSIHPLVLSNTQKKLKNIKLTV